MMTTQTILIVDDDPDIHMLLGAHLQQAGYRTTSAYDGLSCLASVQREVPDLIVLDIGLPAGDGETTLRGLRAKLSLDAVPILVVSGQEESLWGERMDAFGASGYLQKPVDPGQFIGLVQALLAARLTAPAPEPVALPAPAAKSSAEHTLLSCPHCGGEVGKLSAATVAALRSPVALPR